MSLPLKRAGRAILSRRFFSGVVIFVIIAALVSPALEKAFDGLSSWLSQLLLWLVAAKYTFPTLLMLGLLSLGSWSLLELRRGRSQVRVLEQELKDCLAGCSPKKEEKFQRFEDIEAKGVDWAFVDFYPTAFMENRTDLVQGIAVSIFERIFAGVTTRRVHEVLTWSSMLSKLTDGAFDILVTPLYETRDRRGEVAFCSPLFYSDIGVFVRADDRLFADRVEPMTYESLVEWGQGMSSELAIETIEGELHDKLSRKIFSGADISAAPKDCSVNRLIGDRLRSDRCKSHQLQFIERWQGERQVDGPRLRNLLAPGELLFPVSFVVRAGEDTLRRFINLRLLEIGDGESGRGIHELLLKSSDDLGLLAGVPSTEKMDRLAEFFRRSVPPSIYPPEHDAISEKKPLDFRRT